MTTEATIKTLTELKNTFPENSYPDEFKSLENAIEYVERWIPKKVIRNGQWSAIQCPTCGHELSTYQGDGYYIHNDWLEYCPNDKCHQKLDWEEQQTHMFISKFISEIEKHVDSTCPIAFADLDEPAFGISSSKYHC